MPRGTRNQPYDTDGRNKGTSRKPAPREEVLFTGWANYNFTDADREEYEAWEKTDNGDLLEALQVKGLFKITLAWQEEEEVFLATAFCRHPDSPNAGRMTSQRSQSSLRALGKLIWAIGYRMRDDWGALMSRSREAW